MRTVLEILFYIDAVLLILVILLQSRGSGLSMTFGGSDENFFRKKRGVEKVLENSTIVFGIIFILLALIIPFSDKLASALGI